MSDKPDPPSQIPAKLEIKRVSVWRGGKIRKLGESSCDKRTCIITAQIKPGPHRWETSPYWILHCYILYSPRSWMLCSGQIWLGDIFLLTILALLSKWEKEENKTWRNLLPILSTKARCCLNIDCFRVVQFNIDGIYLVSGPARRPSQSVIDQLKATNKTLKLGQMLCRSRSPDFLLEIIQRQVIKDSWSMHWVSVRLQSLTVQDIRVKRDLFLYINKIFPQIWFAAFSGCIPEYAMAGRTCSIFWRIAGCATSTMPVWISAAGKNWWQQQRTGWRLFQGTAR